MIKSFKEFSKFEEKEINYVKYFIDEGRLYWGDAGAGVIPYCEATRRFLVARRSKHVMNGLSIGILGGKIDYKNFNKVKDEELKKQIIKDTLNKELWEEARFNGDISYYPLKVFKDGNFSFYNFLGVVKEEFEPILNYENDEYYWVTLEQLLNREWPQVVKKGGEVVIKDGKPEMKDKKHKLHFGLEYLLNSDNIEKFKEVVISPKNKF